MQRYRGKNRARVLCRALKSSLARICAPLRLFTRLAPALSLTFALALALALALVFALALALA